MHAFSDTSGLRARPRGKTALPGLPRAALGPACTLYTASVRLHLSTASHGRASPRKGGRRSQMCTGASQTGVRAGSRYRERNFTTEGSKAHTETQVIPRMGKREKAGETQTLTNQWKSLWGHSKVIQQHFTISYDKNDLCECPWKPEIRSIIFSSDIYISFHFNSTLRL